VGSDGIIEICPNRATHFDLALTRTVFDGLSITEAFGRGFRNIQAQRAPFNIQILDVSASQTDPQGSAVGNNTYVTTFHNCWFQNTSTPYKADDFVIVQTAAVWCEFISTAVGVKAAATLQGLGGGRAILTPGQVDPIEANIDVGNRLGAMDVAGLILAAGIPTF
jgi:hypothetical protein